MGIFLMKVSSYLFKPTLVVVDGVDVWFRYRLAGRFPMRYFRIQLLEPYNGWIPFKDWTILCDEDCERLFTKDEWRRIEKNQDEQALVDLHVKRLFKMYYQSLERKFIPQ